MKGVAVLIEISISFVANLWNILYAKENIREKKTSKTRYKSIRLIPAYQTMKNQVKPNQTREKSLLKYFFV